MIRSHYGGEPITITRIRSGYLVTAPLKLQEPPMMIDGMPTPHAIRKIAGVYREEFEKDDVLEKIKERNESKGEIPQPPKEVPFMPELHHTWFFSTIAGVCMFLAQLDQGQDPDDETAYDGKP